MSDAWCQRRALEVQRLLGELVEAVEDAEDMALDRRVSIRKDIEDTVAKHCRPFEVFWEPIHAMDS
jgi:hypothetical protein